MLRKWSKGQGLTEFALILPILLITIFMIVETGRIFQAYVTVQNAAREGARYAVTGQGGGERVNSVKQAARDILSAGLSLIEPNCGANYVPEYYCITVWAGEFDDAGEPGQRVQVEVTYNVRIITPILSAIAPMVPVKGRVEMINEPFGAAGRGHGGALPPTLGVPPTFTPTSTPVPITINEPLRPGDSVVTGYGDTRYSPQIQIWDWTTRTLIGTGSLQANGSFRINIFSPLVAGHTIRAVGTYGYDDAVVGAATSTPTSTGTPTNTPTSTNTPTVTPTSTNTPSPTPTPLPYNQRVNCGDQWDYTDAAGNVWERDQMYSPGSWGYTGLLERVNSGQGDCKGIVNDLYNSYEYGDFFGFIFDDVANGDYYITFLFVEPTFTSGGSRVFDVLVEGKKRITNLDIAGTVGGRCMPHSVSVPVTVSDGQLNIQLGATTGEAIISGIDVSFTAYAPTPTATSSPTDTPTVTPTPTSTPAVPPDLTIASLSIEPTGVITALETITITTIVSNTSPGPAHDFFWTDLYVKSDPTVPSSGEIGVEWHSSAGLAGNGSTTISWPYMFTDVGTFYIYTQADTFDDVRESDETNNISTPLVVTVTYDGPLPSTPTPTPTPEICGDLSGSVLIFIGGELQVPSERVDMSLYEGTKLVATTTTYGEGLYRFDCVPPSNNYMVWGILEIDNVFYMGLAAGVIVEQDKETQYVNLILYPL